MPSGLYVAFTLLMVGLDVTAVGLSFGLAYYLRFEAGLWPFTEYHPWPDYLPLLLVLGLAFPVVFALRRQYQPRLALSRIDELHRTFGSVAMAMVVAMTVSTFLPPRDFAYSRALLGLTWGFSFVLAGSLRLVAYGLWGWIGRRLEGERRLLLVGSGEMSRLILQRIQESPRLGYRPVGLITEAHPVGSQPLDGLPVLGPPEEIGPLVRAHRIREVIIAEPGLPHERIMEMVTQCQRDRVNIRVFPDVFQIISSEVSIDDLKGLPLVTVRDVALRGWRLGVKRAVDIVVSLAVLIVSSPIMLLIALFIKLTSGDGPVFYIQERVGLDGHPFQVIKFRSMRPNAEAQTGPLWARRGDPRVTPLGRLLRRFSLDELPQFINVLIGEMSVVGPRPERPHFVEQFSQQVPRYTERHREKAGLTGWAQINGLRGNVSIEERTTYDLWYVENWNLWLDFKIMLRTVVAIFRGRDAY